VIKKQIPKKLRGKLKFGDAEQIQELKNWKRRDEVALDFDKNGKCIAISCPFCGVRNETIAQETDDWIQWAGCENESCKDCPDSKEFGKEELWSGTTDKKGRLLE